MKEIPKLYMQIAMLIFGAVIALSSIYTTKCALRSKD